MTLTIGMPSYNNPTEVWFTLSALKMYHDLEDVELLLVDNSGNPNIRKICLNIGVRYEKFIERRGASPAKNEVFSRAEGEFVLCIDSHVLLWPGSVEKLLEWVKENPEEGRNLIQGPMAYDSQKRFSWNWKDFWRGNMWGIWDSSHPFPPEEILEVEMMACGLLGCRKDSWLGFHPLCRGFGGEGGVIHEKYRRAGRKTLVLPFLIWSHNFHRKESPSPVMKEDIIANYLLGFEEIDLDPKPIYDCFGEKSVLEVKNGLSK